MSELCLAGDCTRRPEKRGMCNTHYERERRAGRLSPRPTIEDRFFSKFEEDESGCWLWTGRIVWNGYGHFDVGRGVQMAHRFAYELLVGPIPDGLVIDHLCRVRNCVNPDHLEPVTFIENVRRGHNYWRDRTHCKNDHEYVGDNFRLNENGYRICRTCVNERARRYTAERKQKESA